MPKDDKGEIIHLHTAAYNGHAAALSSYILQGGDLEVRGFAVKESEVFSRTWLAGGFCGRCCCCFSPWS